MTIISLLADQANLNELEWLNVTLKLVDFCRCLSTLPRSRLTMTCSPMWWSATEQRRPTSLHCPPRSTLPPSNRSRQSLPLSQASLQSSMGSRLTANRKRANQRRRKLARSNLKKAKLTEKKAAVRRWPGYLSQRRRIRQARGAAADQTAVTVEFRENPVNPVDPNTEQRAPVKVLLHSLWSTATRRTVHYEVDWSNTSRTNDSQKLFITHCMFIWMLATTSICNRPVQLTAGKDGLCLSWVIRGEFIWRKNQTLLLPDMASVPCSPCYQICSFIPLSGFINHTLCLLFLHQSHHSRVTVYLSWKNIMQR